jgi:hypothetical protein
MVVNMASLPSTVTLVTCASRVRGRDAGAGGCCCAPAAIGKIPATQQIPNTIWRRIFVM